MLETNFYGTVIEIDEDVVQVEDIPQILPPEPPPVGQGPPSWRHITPEQKLLSTEVLGISGNNGWWYGTGEKNQDAPRRRLYAMNDRCQCERCESGDSTVPWIDTHLHIAGRRCFNSDCLRDQALGSLLHLELNRLPKNSIVSDFVVGDGKYLADDRLIYELPFWEPGEMVHNGAAMGTGKTTDACKRAEADKDALYLLISPRKSTTYDMWHTRLRLNGSSYGWGLFYRGSDRRYRTIGEYGVMLTLPSLPFVLQQIKRKFGDDIPPIYIFLDEIDFCADLMFANILRGASPEIRGLLRQIVEKHGLVTAGQTEMTATLEMRRGGTWH